MSDQNNWSYPDRDKLPVTAGMFIAQYRMSSGEVTQDIVNEVSLGHLHVGKNLIRWMPAPPLPEVGD